MMRPQCDTVRLLERGGRFVKRPQCDMVRLLERGGRFVKRPYRVFIHSWTGFKFS